MEKALSYNDPTKYCNRTSIDGKPLNPGEVLVPTWIQDGYKIPAENKKNLTTYHVGEFKFRIGFIPVQTEIFATYMKGFWKEINDYVKERREGRCVIGRKANGEPICCPKSKSCKGCTEKYNLPHYNPLKDKYQILSLDYCYEDEDFDYPDEKAILPEEYVCTCCEPSLDEQYAFIIAHFQKENPRYAEIIQLSKQRVSIEDICKAINLKPSRGREEINNAYNALCDFLNLRNYKKNKK